MKRRGRFWPGFVLVFATSPADGGRAALAADARGSESAGHVALEVKACANGSEDAVRRIVGIEIGDLLHAIGQQVPADFDRLTIRCAGNLAWVEAAGGAHAKAVERTLRLDDFPGDAAPRALALAGIEVLAALSPAVRKRLADRQVPTTPRPAAISPQRAPAPALRAASTQVGAAALWRTFLVAGGMSVWGGKVEVESRIGRWWNLGFDVEAAGTQRHVALGAASGLLFSGGAFVGARAVGPRVGGALALGGRLGIARLAGDAGGAAGVVGERVLRPWGGPAACARVHGGLGPWEVALAVEAGRSLLAADGLADNATVLAVRGSWVALSLGAAYRVEHSR